MKGIESLAAPLGQVAWSGRALPNVVALSESIIDRKEASMNGATRILVVGCGKMGSLHARAYHGMDDFEIVGLVSRDMEIGFRLSAELDGLPLFDNYEEALAVTRPDAVSINTYPDTHAVFCMKALDAGCNVFVEKPLAETLAQAQAVANFARKTRRKVVVGYILRVHPLWQKFIETAKTLGKPLVIRMNLNQQSSGQTWRNHKNLMSSLSPTVDCGVHYVDVMCQMTEARPVSVHSLQILLAADHSCRTSRTVDLTDSHVHARAFMNSSQGSLGSAMLP
jgi:predicted dehydrogenase